MGNIQEVVNLLLLKGNLGKPGAGACPVRGHSNVQGDRTMGIVERPKEDFLARLDGHLGFTSPRAHGYDTVEAIEAMAAGKGRVFFAMGGNFVAASPDTHYTEAALRRCDLTVQLHQIKPLTWWDERLYLPCLGAAKWMNKAGPQFVSCKTPWVLSPVPKTHEARLPELMSEPAIVALDTSHSINEAQWRLDLIEDYDRIRGIEAVIPGFSHNARVRDPGSRPAQRSTGTSLGHGFGPGSFHCPPLAQSQLGTRTVPDGNRPQSRSIQHHHLWHG